MEVYLRIGLLIIAAAVLFLMFFESRNKQRRAMREIEPTLQDESEKELQFTHSYHQENEDEHEPMLVNTQAEENNHSSHNQTIQPASTRHLLVISVFAKPGQSFASYDLIQAISATGMQFGEMGIFHYYLPTLSGRINLFSLASATEPGDFDMDRIGEFSCSGLTLFLNLHTVEYPDQALDLMLKTAEQLADDLDGELRAGQSHKWNDEMLRLYRQKVAQYSAVEV